MSTLQSTNLKHESSATNNIVLDASGNTAIQGTLRVGGVATNIYPLVSGTSQASTSGTSIDFTGIPSWVKRITVMFNGVSTNGTSNKQIQLGDSGGFETTGYLGASVQLTDAASVNAATITTGFGIFSACRRYDKWRRGHHKPYQQHLGCPRRAD